MLLFVYENFYFTASFNFLYERLLKLMSWHGFSLKLRCTSDFFQVPTLPNQKDTFHCTIRAETLKVYSLLIKLTGGWGNSCNLTNFNTISLVVLLSIPFLRKNNIRFIICTTPPMSYSNSLPASTSMTSQVTCP